MTPSTDAPAGHAMAGEIADIPEAIAHQLARNADVCAQLGAELQRAPPAMIVTCARGSSDHAATFARYVFETRLGIPVSSAAPSIASVYRAPLKLSNAWVIAISQSGGSPDLLHWVTAAQDSGAKVIGIINDESSPLAEAVDHLVPLSVGVENAVAATKSFVGTLTAILQLAASMSGDADLADALDQLPDALRDACASEWDGPLDALTGASSMLVTGRGPGLGIAQEAALKFKETCRLHAEALSSGELPHGPLALVAPGSSVVAFRQNDASAEGLDALVGDLRSKGARVWVARPEADDGGRQLPIPANCHPLVELVASITSFYKLVWRLALLRGIDPDNPPHLRKVTRTC